MTLDEIAFKVAASNGCARRLVVAIAGGTELYRDLFDTNLASGRLRFLQEVATRAGLDTAEAIGRWDALLPRLADEADKRADEAATTGRPQGQGQALLFSWPEPWPTPVALADVLGEVATAVKRHVVFSPQEADACALWLAWAYVIDVFDIAPILCVVSPTRRCGKTTLAMVLYAMAPRPVMFIGGTGPAFFRIIEEHHPTLFVDEFDRFIGQDEALQGLTNAGHTRDTAWVPRCEPAGDSFEVRMFSTWCPKVFLGIGRLPATLEDRSLVIRLQRKPPGTAVARLTRGARQALGELARKLMRWATDHRDDLNPDADPEIPGLLNDRAADNWRPLLYLADVAGGGWPERARRAAMTLHQPTEDDDTDLAVRLLADTRRVFGEEEELRTATLLERLAAIEDAPWATLSHGRPITAHRLARMLRTFGIMPTHRKTGNMYRRQDFTEFWRRYTPDQTFNPSPDDVSTDEIRI